MPNVKLMLFGDARILVDGKELEFRSRKTTALLVYLVICSARASRQELTTLLWPDASTEVAQTSLRNALHEIRQSELAEILDIDRYEISLRSVIYVDVLEFRALLRRIAELKSGEQSLSKDYLALMQRASELYTGDFLASFSILNSPEFEDWQLLMRVDLQYQVTEIFAQLARYYSEQAIVRSAVQMLSRWIDLDPLNEEAHYLLMHNYMLSGQAERAVQQYHILARQTKREFGRLPDEAVQLCYKQIKSGTYVLATKAVSRSKAIRSILPMRPNPLIGRDEDLQRLKTLLFNAGKQPIAISLSGALGIGKTSLVSALVHDDEVQAHYSDGILWASLDENVSPNDVLRFWLDALRISILKSSQRNEHLALQLNTGLDGKNILLVVDNIRSAEALNLFNFSSVASIIFVSPHPYRVGLSATIQPQHALVLQAMKAQHSAEIFDYFAETLSEHQPYFQVLAERYGYYPSAIRGICAAYQQRISIYGQDNIEEFLEALLEDRNILELESNGSSLRQSLERYWQGIAPDIQEKLITSIIELDVDKQYSAAELDSHWEANPESLKEALNYSLLIQNGSALQAHRLLWAYLRK